MKKSITKMEMGTYISVSTCKKYRMASEIIAATIVPEKIVFKINTASSILVWRIIPE
jgi:hypothetical protein